MSKLKGIVGIIWWIFLPTVVWAQFTQGTEFWVGFMEHVDRDKNGKVVVITSDYNTSGKVEMPLRAWSRNFSVRRGQMTKIELPFYAEPLGSEYKDSTSVLITSKDPINVFAHQFANARSDATLVLPKQALGTDYMVMSYVGYEEKGKEYPSEFLIVATEDRTQLEISFTDWTRRGRSPGSTGRVTLNRGQTFQVQAERHTGDLTGTRIRSSKPIALYSGAIWTRVPGDCIAPDNLYEQMYPIEDWGKEYIAVPSEDADYDVIRILAADGNTPIFINGKSVTTLDRGSFLERRISGEPLYISSTKAIAVAQYNVSYECNTKAALLQGDPSMTMLTPVGLGRRDLTIYAPYKEKISSVYLNLVVRKADMESVKIDGDPVSGFRIVPGRPDYAYKRERVSTGHHRLQADGCGVAANCYGYGRLESFAYSSGMGFHLLDARKNPIPQGGCLGDTFAFRSGVKPDYAEVFWNFGDSTYSKAFEDRHAYDTAGLYNVQLTVHNLCLNTYDTLYRELIVTPPLQVKTLPDTIVCAGIDLQLRAEKAPRGATFHWTGPDGFESNARSPKLFEVDTPQVGEYTVLAQGGECFSLPSSFRLDVNDPRPDLGKDTSLCPGEFFSAKVKNEKSHLRYYWQNRSRKAQLRVKKAGLYWVEAVDSLGCRARDTLEVWRKCPPAVFVPDHITPNDDGKNDVFRSFIDVVAYRYKLVVYDEKKQSIFQTTSPGFGWNGKKPDGSEAPAGMYHWKLVFFEQLPTGPKEWESEGWFVLIR